MTKLSSFSGDAFLILAYLFPIAVLGTFIYSIIVADTSGMIASIFFLGFFIITFGREIIKFKKIYFDEKYIYVEDYGDISLSEVKEVGEKTLKFFHNNNTQIVHFNYYHLSSKKIRALKKNIEKFKLKSEPC